MKKSKLKAIFSIVAVMLVIMAFSIPAFAAESYYASDESGNTSIPSSIDSITISKADVDIPHTGDNSSNELTPNGNMSLIDDFLQMGGYITSGKEDEEIKSKQFLTVTSKSGNTFYIVIDRDGDKENVYLLNLVDEADLMALINDGEVEVATCSCKDKCKDGKVNTECELCKVNLAQCAVAETTTEQTTEDTTSTEEEPDEKESNGKGGIILLVVVALAGGGYAIYHFKFKNGKKTNTPVSEPDADDDFDGGYEEEYEIDEADDDETEA